MIRLGLTGSIGMGKSTTAAMFAARGIPVHDADKVVHDLYAGEAAPLVAAAFPGTVRDGIVDRAILGARVLGKPDEIARLEAIVHPLVQAAEKTFLDESARAGHRLVVLDIPLLFETGGEIRVDRTLVVTAPADVQRDRVMARPGMTEERFAAILARQMPDAEKRRRADYLIDTSLGLEFAEAKVADLITVLTSEADAVAARGHSQSRG